MLPFKTEFPQVGADAYVRHTAEPVRILRRNHDGTALVGRTGLTPAQHRATDNWQTDLADLAPTETEARGLPVRRRRAGR